MQLQQYKYNKVNYVVDYRLNQFRSIPKAWGMIDFVEFDSDKGDKILCKMIKDGVADFSKLDL